MTSVSLPRAPLFVFGVAALGASVESWLVPASDIPALAIGRRLAIATTFLGLLAYRHAALRHWL